MKQKIPGLKKCTRLAKIYHNNTMKDCSKYGSPEDSVAFLMWKLNNRFSNDLTNTLYKHNINYNHFMVLAALSWMVKDFGEVNQRALMNFLNMPEITISTIIRKLQKNNYIRVTTSTGDKRSNSVSMTDKGNEFVFSVLDMCMEFEKNIKNRDTIITALKKIS